MWKRMYLRSVLLFKSEAGCWAREQRHSIRLFVGWVCEKFFENKIICNSNKDRFRPKSGLLHHLKRVGH